MEVRQMTSAITFILIIGLVVLSTLWVKPRMRKTTNEEALRTANRED